MSPRPHRFVLILSCPDRRGIVHATAGFLSENGCNIVESAQFCDPRTGIFFMRVAFEPEDDGVWPRLGEMFGPIAERFQMTWSLHDMRVRPRLLLMVSRFGHCLNDILFRHSIGTLSVDIPTIVSNHRDFEGLAAHYGIPFHHLAVTPDTKARQERRLLEIVEAERIDLVVLARYMQVLSDEMCRALDGRAINIHHSFLPSFKGAKPYHQAYDRGVKLIGATAHYVTRHLDEGPIIEQDVARAEHSLGPDELVAIGQDIESVVLARAILLHVERRVMLSGQRTVIFR